MKKENNIDVFPTECTPGEPHRAVQNTTNCRSMTERFQAFFMAPVVIFHLNILSYFAFLLLFAYILMTDFQPVPSWREHVIYLW
ncbi:unnamed protein product, partial [Staurois parvus]